MFGDKDVANQSATMLLTLGPNCVKGYTGVLCGMCDHGYSKGQGGCTECKSNPLVLALLFFASTVVARVVYQHTAELLHHEYYVQMFKEVSVLLGGISRVMLTTIQVLSSLPVCKTMRILYLTKSSICTEMVDRLCVRATLTYLLPVRSCGCSGS